VASELYNKKFRRQMMYLKYFARCWGTCPLTWHCQVTQDFIPTYGSVYLKYYLYYHSSSGDRMVESSVSQLNLHCGQQNTKILYCGSLKVSRYRYILNSINMAFVLHTLCEESLRGKTSVGLSSILLRKERPPVEKIYRTSKNLPSNDASPRTSGSKALA
jgi:hypothetical protein